AAPRQTADGEPAEQGSARGAGAMHGRAATMTAPTPPPPTQAPGTQPPPRSPPLARTQGPRRSQPPRRGPRKFATPVAALLATAIVVLLIGGAGYLASRQLFFLGTNSQGMVTVFR